MYLCLVLLMFLVTASPVRAALNDGFVELYNSATVVDPCATGSGLCTGNTTLLIDRIGDRTELVLTYLAGVAGMIAILFAGVSYVTAGGDDTKSGKAKRILLYGVVTIVVASAVWMIRYATENAASRLITNPYETSL